MERHIASSPLPSAQAYSKKIKCAHKRMESAPKGRAKERTKESVTHPLSPSSADATKEGVGRNRGSSCTAPSSSASTLLISFAPCTPGAPTLTSRSPSLPSQPGPSFPHPWQRGSLALLGCTPSARRSQMVNRSFPLPFFFCTCAHRIFCWAFHSGHTLKKWLRVCV